MVLNLVPAIIARLAPRGIALTTLGGKVDMEIGRMRRQRRACGRAVELDQAEGVSLGVERTPTVFVRDLRFIELFGVEEVVAAIDKALRD